MDNFVVIYEILTSLKKTADFNGFDTVWISMEQMAVWFKVSKNRLVRIWEMLYSEGFVDGISIRYGSNGNVII